MGGKVSLRDLLLSRLENNYTLHGMNDTKILGKIGGYQTAKGIEKLNSEEKEFGIPIPKPFLIHRDLAIKEIYNRLNIQQKAQKEFIQKPKP